MDATVIGIDVAKDRLDVCVRPSGESFVVDRNGAGIEALAERLKRLRPRIVAVEATGGFETVVAAGLAAAELPVVVVNPAQVRAFAQALGKRAKTDPIDAAVIAHFVEATKAEPRALPDAMTRLLADLVTRRRQIVEMMAAEGRVSRASPVHTAVHNCTRDEGRPFEVGSQVLISSHRKLLLSKAMVVSVAETPGHDPGRQG